MREIKFRMWNKDHLLMYNWDKIKMGSMLHLWRFKEYEVMQYTGLHDKNGKEIYEGDITSIIAEDNNENRFVVKFGNARRKMDSGWIVDIPSFYFDLIGGTFKAFPIVENYLGCHDLTMMEIIGNIYENPELLENNK